MACRPWLVLASIVWYKEGHFKYSQANGITHKSILLPKKGQKIRWVNLWSERWANLLYCCMILNLFPFPDIKERSEVHPLHFPSLCSPHNYFSVLAFKTKHISLLKKGGRRKDFSTKIHFAPWILCTRGGSQRHAFWAWVLPHDWCHPPGWFRPPTMWVSLCKAYLSPLTTGGAISNQDPDRGDSVTAETQVSWITAWGLLRRLWTRRCFLGFSVAFSHSTRLNQGWMQCSFFWYPGTLLMSLDMKYEKKKKRKTSNSSLAK